MCRQLVVIQSDDPLEFQEAFNSKLRELEECDPQYEFHHGAGYCAYIIYSEKDEFIGNVGVRKQYLCDSCLKCVEEPRPRVKWRRCALYGAIHGKTECEKYLEVLA